MGILTTSSTNVFHHSAETVYDFGSNPNNWTKCYPLSQRMEGLPDHFPLEIGDTWTEVGKLTDGSPESATVWHLAIAMRPTLWMFNSVSRIATNMDGSGGIDARISVEYSFSEPEKNITIFKRTMTVEVYKGRPVDDHFFLLTNPKYIDEYHHAIARELGKISGS